MPNHSRLHRVTRKKTRYSSDSDSDKDREKSRKYREKPRSKVKDRRSRDRERSSNRHQERRKRYSSSSSSSESSRSSSRSSQSSSTSSRENTTSTSKTSSNKATNKKTFDHITKFEINELYKDEDKSKIIDCIEADSFKQESFQSKKKIVVDLQKDKILVPGTLAADQEEESLIHPNYLGDVDAKVEKWIKKLHIYRNQ